MIIFKDLFRPAPKVMAKATSLFAFILIGDVEDAVQFTFSKPL
jgi:hypothetical protein